MYISALLTCVNHINQKPNRQRLDASSHCVQELVTEGTSKPRASRCANENSDRDTREPDGPDTGIRDVELELGSKTAEDHK